MPIQKMTHDMKALCAEMDARIANLESIRDQLNLQITNGVGVATNTVSLHKVLNSLAHAFYARHAMESSCCNYCCDYDLET